MDCSNRYIYYWRWLGFGSRLQISRYARRGDHADVNFLDDVFVDRTSAALCNDRLVAHGRTHQPDHKYFSPVTIGLGQCQRPWLYELVKQLWRAYCDSCTKRFDIDFRPTQPAKDR